ncbi:hypothetical protein [Frigoribacterium sp. PhB24]|uniref:hypothetical protein n=1 Tax=Frigoribacterium sp. PhB24 TaxID=2485204 RepID=UPI000F9CA2BF|nr:hypothetical protein [Frigoribacterium sp. PhB24]ROS52692.1 hypothetical protein EDF50_1157 [Frigoribacterium sp. PhB24]
MSNTTWRLSSLVREAALNVANPWSRMCTLLLLAALAGSTCASFAACESAGFTNRLDHLEARGSNVLSFQASASDTNVTISRASCEALAVQGGVSRAGLLISEGTRDVPEIGGRTPVLTGSVTLFPPLASRDGLLGPNLVTSSEERYVSLAPAEVRHVSVNDRQPEGIPTNNALVLPLSIERTSAPNCLVVLDRYQDIRTAVATLEPQLEVSGGPLIARTQLSQTSDPVADWRHRPGQYLPLAIGLIGGFCSSLLLWTRANDIAAYRLSGTSKRSLAQLLSVEMLLVVGLFATSGTVAAQVLRCDLVSLSEVFFWMLGGAATWLLAASVGIGRSVVARASTLARER